MNPPPLLVSFSDLDHYLATLPPELGEQFGSEIRRLVEAGLPPVASTRCLAVLFGFSGRFVGAMVRRPFRYYRHFVVPKGRGKRHIHAPRVALKVIQKWLGYHLASAIACDPCAYGFIRGRSAIQAAAIHCCSTWVFSTDIKDFFPSTRISVIRQSLESIGYSPHGAELLASLCSYEQGLAQGSPASPVLSNLAFRPADVDLRQIASDLNIRYTRYADDIVFSGMGAFPDSLPSRVRQTIEKYGWRVAEKKTLLSKLPHRLRVHGLLVHGPTPRLTKGYRNRIRAFRHLMAVHRIDGGDLRRVQGHLAYAASVEAPEDVP